MQAIGYYESLPIDQDAALVDVTLPTPEPGPRDLLVQVRAVSVNPVDVKVRQSSAPANGAPQILGFDAAGIVKAVGSEVTLFRPGDEVFYAGDYQRPGTNAEFHLVDERIVGRKPQSLTFSQAAALPLTAITAWELLFERFDVPLDGLPKDERPTDGRTDGSLLVIGGAGGVGSILIQLARQLTGLTVIATASRPETRAWCEKMGAHHVIDHTKSLPEELRRIGFDTVDFVASLTATAQHFDAVVEMIAPRGEIGIIDTPLEPLDISKIKLKALSFHWEFMFTRPMFETADMIEQHRLLNRISDMVDSGKLRTTLTQDLGPIDAVTLKEAHQRIESGRTIGKLVLSGFPQGSSE